MKTGGMRVVFIVCLLNFLPQNAMAAVDCEAVCNQSPWSGQCSKANNYCEGGYQNYPDPPGTCCCCD